jgi:hypothetical protein
MYRSDTEFKKRFQTDRSDYKRLQSGYKCLLTGTLCKGGVSLLKNKLYVELKPQKT